MKNIFVSLLVLAPSTALFAAGTNTIDNSSSNNTLAVVGFFAILIAAIVIPAVKGGKRNAQKPI